METCFNMNSGKEYVIAIQGSLIGRSEKAGPQGAGTSETMFTLNTIDRHAIAIVPRMETVKTVNDQLSMFSSEELPVSPSQSQDSDREWLTLGEISPLSILQSLNNAAPVGWYGKTSPVSCRRMEDGTLVPLSEAWSNSGIARAGECLTLSTSEYPSDVEECSLSQVLETGEIPQKFYLSQKACSGILRRAENRGKMLPPALQKALEDVAGG
jgi:hypothetical protein